MKKRIIWLLVFIMAGTCFYSANTARAENENNKAVKEAADQFYAALNTLFTGNAGPMDAVWSHQDNITYMGPDGTFEVGWENVKAVWEKQAAKKMGGKVTPAQMQITSSHHMGITFNYEIGENFDKDGNPVKVSIRATNVFHKNEGGQWKMIGHHTDILPFLQEKSVS